MREKSGVGNKIVGHTHRDEQTISQSKDYQQLDSTITGVPLLAI